MAAGPGAGRGALSTLLRGEPLSREVAAWAMREIMTGEATQVQLTGFVVALRAKGETAEEVGALVEVMLELAAPLPLPPGLRAVDTCGTGGDRAATVNVSTMAALVVAGTGATVVKHGNRAATSACGSADLLEALGVVIDLPPAGVLECVAAGAPAFCFAPVFHPAMRYAALPRRELGVPTVFNILGPLTNPARPLAQVVGVADPRLAPVMAEVLASRGASALVVRGEDGLDELSVSAPSAVWWARDGRVERCAVDPQALGLRAGDIVGGDPARNAAVCREFLAGADGPVRDAVLLNAAGALVALAPTDAALAEQLRAGLARAAESVDSGAAAAALDRWVEASQAAARRAPG